MHHQLQNCTRRTVINIRCQSGVKLSSEITQGSGSIHFVVVNDSVTRKYVLMEFARGTGLGGAANGLERAPTFQTIASNQGNILEKA